jgi:NADPH-dependent 2,4-dienoyl-CoA reductase/sulfur reductase-like enzyme
MGAHANVAWLADSGLEMDNRLRCDEYSRCDGTEDVYSVGDVARWWSVRASRAKRVEHWTNAVEQASCVAHNIFNKNDLRVHDPIEYVWSDQFDWKIQTVGHTGGSPDLLLENESRADSFAALHSDDHGQLSGAVIVNWPKALITCRRALSEATQMRDTTDALARIQEAAPPA